MTRLSKDTIEQWRPKRIGIIGAGAMGSSLAAIVGSQRPVVLVCRRPERAAEIFRDGVRTTGLIKAHARPIVVQRIEDLAEIGGVSAIFVATKTTAIPSVASDLHAVLDSVGDQPGAPFVVSYQNGIEPGRQLISMLGDDRVLRMVLSLGAIMPEGSTTVHITLSAPPHHIGALNEPYRMVCERIAALLTVAGFETHYEANIERSVWAKGVVNAAMNPVAALTNMTVGDVLDSPSRMLVHSMIREGVAVATADGVDLGGSFWEKVQALLEKALNHLPSMVEDIRAGRESEVGQLNRQIIEFGRRYGVPTPTHDVVDALIESFDWKVYQRRRENGATSPP